MSGIVENEHRKEIVGTTTTFYATIRNNYVTRSNPPDIKAVEHLLSDRPSRRRVSTEDEHDIRESLRALADAERTSLSDLRKELGMD